MPDSDIPVNRYETDELGETTMTTTITFYVDIEGNELDSPKPIATGQTLRDCIDDLKWRNPDLLDGIIQSGQIGSVVTYREIVTDRDYEDTNLTPVITIHQGILDIWDGWMYFTPIETIV